MKLLLITARMLVITQTNLFCGHPTTIPIVFYSLHLLEMSESISDQ